MKIALLQPPVEDFYQTSIRTQPVGLLYLAAALESAGHDVRIFDFPAWGQKKSIPLPRDFSYLAPHFHLGDSSPIRIFKHYYHFGAGWPQIEQTLAGEDFDVYGIASMFTPFHSQAERLAELIGRLHPGRSIVAGGTHATACAKRLRASGLFNCVFPGEGEISFPNWIASLQKEDGIHPAVRIEALDSLPFPARHLIDLDRYHIAGVRSTMLITSRGCPYRCTFCSVQQTMGHEFRVRSVENVLAEIEECVERFGILHFDIEDDNFTFDERRAEQILTAILDRFGQGTLRFSAMNGLTATQLGTPLLRRMQQVGFRQINLSLVAAQPQTLHELKRPVSLSGFRRTVEAARQTGLEIVAYFILGLPGDDVDKMLETLLALASEPVLVGPSVFYVSPGTELFDVLEDRIPENWDLLRSSTFYMEDGSSTRLQRVTLFRLTRAINFLKERLDAGTWQAERDEAIQFLTTKLDYAPSSAVLGWAVLQELCHTGKFHAVCRNRSEGSKVTLEPLPTCEETVRKFFARISDCELRGVQSSNRCRLSEMLAGRQTGLHRRDSEDAEVVQRR
ncbi:MAG: B12-binding domain-containing radical SAM protein [Acidobacteriota bacterium]